MLAPLKTLLADIEADYAKFTQGHNKAAGTRVRVKSMLLSKAAKALRDEVSAQAKAMPAK